MKGFYIAVVLALPAVVGVASAPAQQHPADPGVKLFQALENGDILALRRLLAEGADIESKDVNGETPLIVAAGNSNIEALRFLLDHGANVAARDNQNETALIHAPAGVDTAGMEILLHWTSDKQEKNDALITAVRGGTVAVVIRSGGPDTGASQTGVTEEPEVRKVRLLLDSGADIEARDEEGSTPLLIAAGYGETEAFEFLLLRGANVRARDKRGATALINAACECALATMNSTYDIVKSLLDRGANVNARQHDGTTALMMASGMTGEAAMLELLLSRGANLFARDSQGRTALKIALQSRREDKIRVLRQATAKAR